MPLDTGKIKALRLRLGLSQSQAAEAAKLAHRHEWSDIETGRRPNLTIETLERIAAALGVKAKDLLK